MPAGMKKVFLSKATDFHTSDLEGVGIIRFEGNKVYKYCMLKNTTATVAVVAGDGVAYDAEDGHINSHVVSDLSDAGTKPVGAGCVLASIPGVLAVAYYCWVQIKGAITLAQTIGASVDASPVACADGDPIQLTVATDKTFRRVNTVIDADTELGYQCGIAIDASAKYAILDCPF
jgi:hypothetical protein